MSGFATLVWVDLKLYGRNVVAGFFTLAFPVLLILLFGAMYGNEPNAVLGGFGSMDVSLPGYIAALVIGSTAFMGLPIELVSRRERGVLRRFRATPLRALAVLGSQLVTNLAFTILGTLLLVLTARLAWNVRMPVSPLALVPAYLLCCLSQYALGLLLASVLRSTRAALAVCMAVFYPMMFLSGGTIPLELLPPRVQAASRFLPMSWAVRLLRDVWFGLGWDPVAVAVLLGVLVLGAAASSIVFRWE